MEAGVFIVAIIALLILRSVFNKGRPLGEKPPLPPLREDVPLLAQPQAGGRFCIQGVDRNTKMDTTWRVRAESEANARTKAELEGIIVTSCEFEGK